MHSSYETAAVADVAALEDAMTAFYGMYLEATENGFKVL
jgi:aspartyl aminopeptidase